MQREYMSSFKETNAKPIYHLVIQRPRQTMEREGDNSILTSKKPKCC